MRGRKFLKRKFEYRLIITISALARLLPRRMGHWIFSALGGLASALFREDRRRAVANLGVAFPEAPAMVRDAMAEAMFRNLGRNVFDFLNLRNTSAECLASLVEDVQGMQHYLEADAARKGVIGITGHIGCWEIVPAYFVSIGHPVTVVARRMRNERLNEALLSTRASVGVATIDREASPREMIRVLRRGEMLGVLVDQHTNVGGMYVPFFNRPAFTPTGVAKLSCLTGAPIVPMADYLNRNGRHTIHVLPAIVPPPQGVVVDKDAVVRKLTAECSLALEKLIRMDPKQWVWFHNRWREVGCAAVA